MSLLDESSMTGESLPMEKHAGDSILAGTLNLNGVLRAETTQVGQETTLGKVLSLVGQAEQHRPRAVRLIDRYATWFTPIILGCAGLTLLLTGSWDRAVAVLIVGCPCALILVRSHLHGGRPGPRGQGRGAHQGRAVSGAGRGGKGGVV